MRVGGGACWSIVTVLTAFAVVPGAALAADPPGCGKSWTEEYAPALDAEPEYSDELPEKLAVGRRFSFYDHDFGSAYYRRDFPSVVSISTGANDPKPYFDVFHGDLRAEDFRIKPERRAIGRIHTVAASWVEDDGEGGPPCRRSRTYSLRAIRGLPPKINLRHIDDETASFKVVQRKGIACEQTPPGAVRISIRGPGGRRILRLSDTCGDWPKRSKRGRGWRLYGWENYAEDGNKRTAAEAYLEFTTDDPGTRKFRARVTFRGRTLHESLIKVRTRFCLFGVCRG